MPSQHAGKPVTVRLNEEEMRLLSAVAEGRSMTKKAAIVAGLQALRGTNAEDLPAALERAAARLRALQGQPPLPKAPVTAGELPGKTGEAPRKPISASRFAKKPIED